MFIQCPSRVGALIFPSIVIVFIDKFDFMYVFNIEFCSRVAFVWQTRTTVRLTVISMWRMCVGSAGYFDPWIQDQGP